MLHDKQNNTFYQTIQAKLSNETILYLHAFHKFCLWHTRFFYNSWSMPKYWQKTKTMLVKAKKSSIKSKSHYLWTPYWSIRSLQFSLIINLIGTNYLLNILLNIKGNPKQEMPSVVAIAMICYTLDSLWKIPYFWRPIITQSNIYDGASIVKIVSCEVYGFYRSLGF